MAMKYMGKLGFDVMYEIGGYHTWIIKAGATEWIYVGTPKGIKKAKEEIEKRYPPSYTVHVKKVN